MKAALFAALAVMFVATQAAAAVPTPTDSANPAYMWDLGDLYSSPEAWSAAQAKATAAVEGLDKYKGTLGKNAQSMLSALDAISMVGKEVARLNVYASLKGDEDVRIAANQERVQLGQTLQTRFGEKTAWISTEVLSVGAGKVQAFEKQAPELAHRC